MLIGAAAIVVTVASVALPFMHGFWPVAATQALAGACAAIFAPAVAAITLGIFGHGRFARRTGRNEAFNHAGNACAAAAAGAAAYAWGPVVVFFLLGLMAVATLISVLAVPADAIDHQRARGLADGERVAHDQPSGLRVLLRCRPLLVFAACAVLFHFANAAMLPLVGQKLALADARIDTSLMAACIVAAQLVMVPMAVLAGHKADSWGRKPLFLAGFLILTMRGVLYTLSDATAWLVGVPPGRWRRSPERRSDRGFAEGPISGRRRRSAWPRLHLRRSL